MAPPKRTSKTADTELADAIREGWHRGAAELNPENATSSVSELVEIIGAEATEHLCARFGGLSFEISTFRQELIEAIGADNAEALREYWGSGRIYVPRRAMAAKARHQIIRDMAKRGFTRHQIAHCAGVSERQVYNVLASVKAAERGKASNALSQPRPKLRA